MLGPALNQLMASVNAIPEHRRTPHQKALVRELELLFAAATPPSARTPAQSTMIRTSGSGFGADAMLGIIVPTNASAQGAEPLNIAMRVVADLQPAAHDALRIAPSAQWRIEPLSLTRPDPNPQPETCVVCGRPLPS